MAVLLNPPSASSGMRSRNAVERAATLLGYDEVVIANLCAAATPSVAELNSFDQDAWAASRAQLNVSMQDAAGLLAGWGVAGLSGDARRWLQAQVEWLIGTAESCGIGAFWTVGGEPRHPSRWHQYVSDKYGRTSGGSFEERLKQVLIEVPTECWVTTARHSRSIQVSSSR
ncbi:DUF1643 domain-containing protein [Nocardioides sp. LHD-245]|uniref:DUF1643 domain-containing protein n=1 Tax=Nocardioides sp. LHD-245 TaxID=3051387 RepID=UPI0027E18703|nr:DUF1643 domain-containing protein [Nocardioides sp. LHD-245]